MLAVTSWPFPMPCPASRPMTDAEAATITPTRLAVQFGLYSSVGPDASEPIRWTPSADNTFMIGAFQGLCMSPQSRSNPRHRSPAAAQTGGRTDSEVTQARILWRFSVTRGGLLCGRDNALDSQVDTKQSSLEPGTRFALDTFDTFKPRASPA